MITLLSHQFIQYAFLAGGAIAIVCAVVGYFVVMRSQAFATHALSHIGFAGATGAALLGISALSGTFLFTLLAALGMGSLGERIRGRDVEIGMVLSFALGLGVLFLKLYTVNSAEAVGILFGSILSVTKTDLLITLSAAIITIVTLAFIYRPLLFSSIDPEIAQARGVPVRFLSLLFMLLLALTVAQAVLVVGILLVFALIVAPPATAGHFTNRPLNTIIVSILLGIVFCWGGLFLAILLHGPVSFFIAGIASATYLGAVTFAHRLFPHTLMNLPHVNREN